MPKPYPQSPLFLPLSWESPVSRYSQGGDQWPQTEQADGALLFIGNDENGWNNNHATKSCFRVIRVTGDPPDGLSGVNLDFRPFADICHSQGIIALPSNTVALFYTYESAAADGGGKTYCGISTTAASVGSFNWHGAAGEHVFSDAGANGLVVQGVLQLDAGYASGPDIVDRDYVYVTLNGIRQQSLDGYLANKNGGTIWMARVKIAGASGAIANLYDSSKYAMFTGMSGGAPTWGSLGSTTTRTPIYVDNNGIGLRFDIGWHAGINKFVASYIHQPNSAGGIAVQGVAIAIADTPWDQTSWQLICYDTRVPLTTSENNRYLACTAPGRWNDGTNMHLALSTYVQPGGSPGDNLIATRAALSASVGLDSFSYTVADDWGQITANVTMTIEGGGVLFVTASDDGATTSPGTAVTIPVLSNDTASASLLPLVVQPGSLTTPSPSGTVAITTDNQIRYTPASGASGLEATFSYTAKPSTAATPTSTATVRVQVESQPGVEPYVKPADLSFAGATTVTVSSTAALQAAINGQANNTSLIIRLSAITGTYGSVTKDWAPADVYVNRRLKIVAVNKVFTAYNPMTNVKTNHNPGQTRVNGKFEFSGFDVILIEGLEFERTDNMVKFVGNRTAWMKHCSLKGLASSSSPVQCTLQGNLLAVVEQCHLFAFTFGHVAKLGPLSPDWDYSINWYYGKDFYFVGSRIEGMYHQPLSMKTDLLGRGYGRIDYSRMQGQNTTVHDDADSSIVLGQQGDGNAGDATTLRCDILRTQFKCGPRQVPIKIHNIGTVIVDGCSFDGGYKTLQIERDNHAPSGGGTATVKGPTHPTLTHMKNCTINQNVPITLKRRDRPASLGPEILRLENNQGPVLLSIDYTGTPGEGGLAKIERIGGNASGFKA